MTPFRITCVTCQARLAVRSASLIGQILACPKCGSMVQVTAPAANAATSQAAHDSASGLGTVVLGSAAAALTAPTPETVAHQPPVFDDVADFGESVSQGSSPRPATANSHVAPTPRSAVPPVASAAKRPASGWGVAKLAALGVGSAIAGSVLVAGVFTLLRSEATVAPPAAPNAATAPRSEPSAVTKQPEIANAPIANDAEAPAVAEQAPPLAGGQTRVAPVEDPQGAIIAAPPVDAPPAAAQEPPADALATAPPTAEVQIAAASAAGDAETPRLRIDPLDLDPEGLDLSTLLNGESGPSADSIAMSDIEQDPEPVDSAAPANDERAAAPIGPPEGGRVAEGAEIEPPAAAKILLARRMPAVKVSEMPLALFIDFATGFSAVPVSVSEEELQLAAVASNSAVSVDVQDATLEQMLTEGLRPLRLAPTVVDGQIVLRRSSAGGRRQLAYPVDDLVAGDAKELANLVARFVTPEAWQSGGGDERVEADGTTLRVDAEERVGFATILFLEQYRVACGLPPKSKYPLALLQSRAAKGDLAARLVAPATFTFTRPTALRDLFRWWRQEADIAILVDWPALAEQRLAPHSRITASVAAKPWSDALTTVLEPLGLGWRIVDKRTLEISTLAKLSSEPTLEIYGVAEGGAKRSADILARARTLSASKADATFDAAHGVLIVRGPATMQRDLLAWLLAEKLLPTVPTP